ncbi:MAG TPA: FHA domain-containing protein [Spongiibacteraceae bacterium]|jgi:hypothetical protein|nr:FHA domain-containing protein [Spongiibacteraceae bacterium]HUH38770.1 FHA domain-containing protein [Spongiibacteraceae bacterium]
MANRQAHTTALSAGEQLDASRWRLIGEGDWLDGQVFLIGERAVLGRDLSCDIIIPGKHLSRRHAELLVQGDKLLLRDLGSANGTYFGDERIAEKLLSSGDRVRFDVLNFRVQGPATHTRSSINPPPASPGHSAYTADAADFPPRQWQTRPTAVGNRHRTGSYTLPRRRGQWFWRLVSLLLIGVAATAVYYLLQQL